MELSYKSTKTIAHPLCTKQCYLNCYHRKWRRPVRWRVQWEKRGGRGSHERWFSGWWNSWCPGSMPHLPNVTEGTVARDAGQLPTCLLSGMHPGVVQCKWRLVLNAGSNILVQGIEFWSDDITKIILMKLWDLFNCSEQPIWKKFTHKKIAL